MRYLDSAENTYYCVKDQPYKAHPLGNMSKPKITKIVVKHTDTNDDQGMTDRIFFNKE